MKTAAVFFLSVVASVTYNASANPGNLCAEANAEKIPEGCRVYIEGFLDGALETDSAIIKKMDGADAAQSQFLQRAYKTRLGTQLRDLPATFLADFCLPLRFTREELISRIALRMSQQKIEPSFSATIYRTVKEEFPCE